MEFLAYSRDTSGEDTCDCESNWNVRSLEGHVVPRRTESTPRESDYVRRMELH